MAQQQQDNQQQGASQPSSQNTFDGGMVKDTHDMYKRPNTYTHGRNLANMLPTGEYGAKHSEPSNVASISAPYTIIGTIYLAEDKWVIFSTDNTHSEIGLFIDTGNTATDTYTPLINDSAAIAAGMSGMKFNKSNLITGAARRGFECGFDVYWSDGQLNPDRMFNTAACPFTTPAVVYPNPWLQSCTTPTPGCVTCVNTNKVVVDKLRLDPILEVPCMKLAKHKGPGQLKNGSYQVCMAYAMNGVKFTDYVAFSDVYSTFTHLNNGGAFDLTISGITDVTKQLFTEMELVVVSMVNQQVIAKKLGIYSTSQSKITIDAIDETLPTIPIERLTILNPGIVSSDAIFPLSGMLTRVGPSFRADFNYQPLANQIQAGWAVVSKASDYYHIGGDEDGMAVGYLRGERYAFFIRWVYNDGTRSSSYPIPGLPGGTAASLWGGTAPTSPPPIWGSFAGYSSTEIYPDHSTAVWGALCGQPIRHFQFPDQALNPVFLSHFNADYGGFAPPLGDKGTIGIMGVYFYNIQPPVDNTGKLIPDVVGYEILRASREGHASILAKGMINNMRQVTTDGGTSTQLFNNYPYNDIGEDYFLTKNSGNILTGTTGSGFADPLPDYWHEGFSQTKVSFHSPDTVFNHPYLGTGNLEVVQLLVGQSTGVFNSPYKHPMFKVLTNFDSILTDILSVLATLGNLVYPFTGGWDFRTGATESIPLSIPIAVNPNYPGDNLGGVASPMTDASYIAATLINTALAVFLMPLQARIIAEQLNTSIKATIPGRQYAVQYNSWGEYNIPSQALGTFPVDEYAYIKGQMQSFGGMVVNNLYRNDYVLLDIPSIAGNVWGEVGSRFNLGPNSKVQGRWYNQNIQSAYAAYRVPQSAQYGQIDSPKQIPIGCVQNVKPRLGDVYSTPVLFGGDTYINRYTEKNPFMFFNDWLVDAPEDFKYDYRDYINVPYPMFWINNDVVTHDLLSLASTNRRLDGPMNINPFWVDQGYFYLFCNGIRDFFVESTVNVGYRDWEDEISKEFAGAVSSSTTNQNIRGLFYDPHGAAASFVNDYFRSDVIKSSALYKYDYSLSASKFINQYISWGNCLRRDYDPILAFSCFNYYPRRVHYSLPQDTEMIKDNWRMFLPNNYKNFNDQVWAIKELHKSGGIFLMKNTSPQMFAGTESMPSKSGTEYTVGTGELFTQTLQSVGNTDDSYEHGSCQSRMGVVNTPYGIFWVSQKTGKLFTYREGQPFDIGEAAGLKHWLLKYLPSQILVSSPNFPLQDNPVAGVGVQLIYDPLYEMLYICKRDFVPTNANYSNGQWYVGPCPPGSQWVSGSFSSPVCLACVVTPCPGTTVNFGDPAFFKDASWTLSYDCKKQEFVSFHDWHPTYHIASRNHFLTTPGSNLWRHNTTTQSFCNFYGTNYPMEIEFFANTQTTETILQNVEWLLESYKYSANGVDKFLNYDASFDQIMVYNKEQNSTLQNILRKPLNDPYTALNYPLFAAGVRTALYSKVENKYRFNDFYDYTMDRGQNSFATTPMIATDPNGYTFSTVAPYFNLTKAWNQLKRMRYTGSKVFLRKNNLGSNSVSLRYASTKNQYSPR